MSIGDWLQAISALLVALALGVGALQLRQMEKQTTAASGNIQQMAYESMNQAYSDYRVNLLKDDPDLLAWHLQNSAYPVGDHESNKRTLFMMGKLDAHERNVINYRLGLLSEDAWKAWGTVLEADVVIPEFRAMWPAARRFYAPPLVQKIDQIIHLTDAS